MKKYSIFFAILVVMGLMFSTSAIRAEDDNEENEGRSEWNNLQTERKAFMKEQREKREAFKAQIDADRKAFNDGLKADREAFRAEVKIARDAFKLANAERKEEFQRNAKRMIGERFEVAVRNLERMQGRIADAIEALDAEDEDTALAEEFLALSKTKLDAAKVEINKVKLLIPENGEKVTPEDFEAIKLGAREAKNLLKESHRALVDALKAIKDLKSEAEDEDEAEDTE